MREIDTMDEKMLQISTEKSFDTYDDAIAYSAYLSTKSLTIDVYEVKTYASGELDIEALKRQDALDKLTPEEKALLGLQHGKASKGNNDIQG